MGAGATLEQLVTRLHASTHEMLRAQEELDLLAAERQRCVRYLAQQEAAINTALQCTAERQAAVESASSVVPPCSSFQHRQPGTTADRRQESNYCAGLILLLSDRLRECQRQLAAARTAFGASDDAIDWAAAAAVVAPPNYIDEEDDEEEL